jgi:hypothetical protein
MSCEFLFIGLALVETVNLSIVGIVRSFRSRVVTITWTQTRGWRWIINFQFILKTDTEIIYNVHSLAQARNSENFWLTPWGRVLLENATVSQLTKKFHAFSRNPMFHYRVHKIHSNNILTSMPISPEWFFSFDFFQSIITCRHFSLLACVLHLTLLPLFLIW